MVEQAVKSCREGPQTILKRERGNWMKNSDAVVRYWRKSLSDESYAHITIGEGTRDGLALRTTNGGAGTEPNLNGV